MAAARASRVAQRFCRRFRHVFLTGWGVFLMTAQRWLQIHLVALCLLGSLFVALSTKNLTVPLGVLLAGALSVWLTDIWKWFRLNRMLGNLAAIGAVLYSLSEFLAPNNSSEGQLQAIATLL